MAVAVAVAEGLCRNVAEEWEQHQNGDAGRGAGSGVAVELTALVAT